MSSNVTGALMQGRDSIGFARTGPSIWRICATIFRSQAGSPCGVHLLHAHCAAIVSILVLLQDQSLKRIFRGVRLPQPRSRKCQQHEGETISLSPLMRVSLMMSKLYTHPQDAKRRSAKSDGVGFASSSVACGDVSVPSISLRALCPVKIRRLSGLAGPLLNPFLRFGLLGRPAGDSNNVDLRQPRAAVGVAQNPAG